MMRRFASWVRRRFTGATALGLLVVATLGLAGWLGYQAVDAALSHRRTAEAVLRDYAGIAAAEMTRVSRGNLADVLDDVFDPVSRRRRGRDLPSAAVLGREMVAAMRGQRCACPAFRAPLALFRLEPRRPALQVLPDTLSPATRDRIIQSVLEHTPNLGRGRGLLTMDDPAGLSGPVAIGYMVAEDTAGVMEAAYGFVVSAQALAELFRDWYDDRQLLPQPIAGDQPNDSLLHLAVLDPAGNSLFASSEQLPASIGASASLGEEFGGLIVQATIRPDAADRLVIGGLPRSRLPLLAALLGLTLAVGLAAFVQLRREQKFQRLREDFVSGVSHELRTPLAQIRMFAELQQAGKLRSEADRSRAVFVVNREARRLTHLVENILQFSQLRRSPGHQLPREPLDLADGIADGIDAVTPLLADRRMELELATEPGVIVVANREALTRIIVNLLDNAVKYGPRGQRVTVGVSSHGGLARLSVADQGPGVPSADRTRIWKPYRRLERDVNSRLPGTGIGLSVVAELASLHGGRAWVEAAPGGGALFVVELPLSPAGAPTTISLTRARA